MSKDKDFILERIPRIKRFTLGTIDDDGRPWVEELKLAFDESLHIIWHSKKGTVHSKHIAVRPDVAIRSRHINKPLPLPAAYLGDSPDRLYCAVISETLVNDQSKIKRPVDLH